MASTKFRANNAGNKDVGNGENGSGSSGSFDNRRRKSRLEDVKVRVAKGRIGRVGIVLFRHIPKRFGVSNNGGAVVDVTQKAKGSGFGIEDGFYTGNGSSVEEPP